MRSSFSENSDDVRHDDVLQDRRGAKIIIRLCSVGSVGNSVLAFESLPTEGIKRTVLKLAI